MVIKWLRENKYAAVLLALLRIYVGWEWLQAGWHKLNGAKPFDATGFLNNAIAKPITDSATHEAAYPTYLTFLKHVALPHIGWFNFSVPWGEFLVGLGLILGVLTTTAMFFGLLMNFMYLFAGTVSTNPWLILLGAIILAAGANAGRVGVGYYAVPYIRRLLEHVKHAGKGHHGNRNRPVHV